MPRPKRTKVAPSVPASGGVGRINSTKSPDVLDDISDKGEFRAIGGKRPGDGARILPDSRSSAAAGRLSMGSKPFGSLEGQRKRQEEAIGRLEAENLDTSVQAASTSEDAQSSPGVEIGRRAISTTAAEASVMAIGNFQGRGRQPNIQDFNASRPRSSSVESNLAESNGITKTRMMDNSAVRGRFRRRERQPSILGRANSRVRSSSVDYQMEFATPGNLDSVMGPGTFRRRSRQPSILGTRNTVLQKAGEVDDHGVEDRSEDEDDDEEEFNPEDESTPLNLSKTISTIEGSQSASSILNPRKRKLSPLATPRSSPRLPAYGSEAESDSGPSPRDSVAEAAPPTTPERLSDIMAPPRSSSPAASAPEVILPSRRTNIPPSARSTRRQPARRPLNPPNPDSLPSSPPSLTHSPNQAIPSAKRDARGRTRIRPQPADYSTIQLQALLPRRRHRPVARDQFEIESSDDTEVDLDNLGSDEDELAHLSSRNSRPGPANPRIMRPKPGTKAKATFPSKGTPGNKPRRRTTTTTTSDKENQPGGTATHDQHQDDSDGVFHSDEDIDPNDSLAPLPEVTSAAGAEEAAHENSQELEARVGKELKNAKRKFEVVDRWELEFEDCTGSSSPWDGR